MRIEVDTPTVIGVGDAVRRAATAVEGVDLPRAPVLEDIAAADAIAALLAVSAETMASCVHALHGIGLLIELAARDYERVEMRLQGGR